MAVISFSAITGAAMRRILPVVLVLAALLSRTPCSAGPGSVAQEQESPPAPPSFVVITGGDTIDKEVVLYEEVFAYVWEFQTLASGRSQWVLRWVAQTKTIQVARPSQELRDQVVKYRASGFPERGLVLDRGGLLKLAPPRPELPGPLKEGDFYAPNLGIVYTKIRYQNGTFGARLKRDALRRTPAAAIGLEEGDVVFALDDDRFVSTGDVLNHRAQTTVDFVNIRKGRPERRNVVIP
jgi:hypothetical protein